jgi:phosphoribosylaminoimidazole synthetase
MGFDYKSAGVDIDKANILISDLKKEISKTYNKYVLSGVGGFGALISFDLSEFDEPVVSISTDGVGTKLLLAKRYDMIDGIGIDLVAMNVDDVVCTGAKPVAFVDYYACGKLIDDIYKRVLKGIIEGCKIAGVALVGGETAEMPGLYKDDEFDLSGTAIGFGSKKNSLPKEIVPEDVLIGLESSGFHSNGYSLIRKVIESKNLDVTKDYGFSRPLIELLLEPTRIYCKHLYPLVENGLAKGFVHVTGGGIVENTVRVVSQGTVSLYYERIKTPEFMNFIIKEGDVSKEEAFRVFNMGVGMIVVSDKKNVDKIIETLRNVGFDYWIDVIGAIV